MEILFKIPLTVSFSVCRMTVHNYYNFDNYLIIHNAELLLLINCIFLLRVTFNEIQLSDRLNGVTLPHFGVDDKFAILFQSFVTLVYVLK